MTIILFGVFWGFVEATLGGLLHVIKFPMTGSIMAPIGFAILFMALRQKATGGQLFAITVIASAFKFFDVFLFNLSPFQMMIINPAQAILMQGLSFMAFAWLLKSQSPVKKLLAATSMTVISFVLFNLISYFVVGQVKTPLFTAPLTTLALHVVVSIVVTYLLINLISRSNQAMIEMFTLKGSSFAVRAATTAFLIIATVAVHKWFI